MFSGGKEASFKMCLPGQGSSAGVELKKEVVEKKKGS